MKSSIFLIVSIFLSLSVFAQSPVIRPLNNINLNLFGDASLISINFERIHSIRPNLFIATKLGLGYNEEFQLCIFGPCSEPQKQFATIPHHITGNLGSGRHILEFGVGGTIIVGNTNETYIAYPIIGYRFQPLKTKKLNFRLFGQFPFTGIVSEDIIFIPFGINMGFCF